MKSAITLLCSCWLFIGALCAQTVYYYPLLSNFDEVTASAPALTPMPNSLGQIGTFAPRNMPFCSCNGVGAFDGYDYPINAGLRWTAPPGFGGCEYTIQFTWQFDNPAGLIEWIKILTFNYTDDSGFNLWTQPPSTDAGVHYWHLDTLVLIGGLCFAGPETGPMGPLAFLDDCKFRQFTFTRTCDNTVRLYIDGAFIGSFVDNDQFYLPQNGSNQIVFFRDTVNTACYPTPFPGEASTGFVKDLRIADYAFTAAEIAQDTIGFCPTVLGLNWVHHKALLQAQGQEIQWQLDFPDMVDEFIIERSLDGELFTTIGQGAPDHFKYRAGEGIPFRFMDQTYMEGKVYYRINALDQNGQLHQSPVMGLRMDIAWKVFPNPASDQISIQYPEDFPPQMLQIYSPEGRLLHSQPLDAGLRHIPLTSFPDGLLLLRAGRFTKRILHLTRTGN